MAVFIGDRDRAIQRLWFFLVVHQDSPSRSIEVVELALPGRPNKGYDGGRA